jgi:carbon-monoxide dehydrogenase medium subunit
MYSTDFAYHAPASLADALHLLQSGGENGDVKLLAGGQSLLAMMKLRLAEPATLIDIAKVPELRGISEEGNGVVLGAATTYFQAIDSPLVQRRCPLIVQALQQVGDPQVRARGTIGGSLAHADPAGDLPAVAQALNAEIRAMGSQGSRSIAARDFFEDMLTTALSPTEVLTSVRFEATDTPRTGVAYAKHRHPASGYAVVGVAAVVRLAEDGTCADVRVGLTGAGTHAVRATKVEQALIGKTPDQATITSACASITDGLDLMSDPYASEDFRAHLAQVYGRRALIQAAAQAHGQP